jgi:murein DD-endopeptidase MepM/ murein hydrolase activator NlpD
MQRRLMARAILRGKRFLSRPLTLLVVPPRGSDIRSIKLPLWLAAITGVFLSALLLVAGLACFRSAQMQAEQAELARLRQVNAQQEAQLQSLQQQAQQERATLQEIKTLEQRLRAMVGLGGSGGQASRSDSGGGTPEQRAMLLAGLFQSGPSVVEVAADLNRTDQDAAATREALLVLQGQVSAHIQALNAMPDHWPVSGPITSPFGWRHNPFGNGSSEFHTGIDIAAPYGTSVEAAGAGTVVFVGYKSGYGRVITIDHGNGYQTSYCHLSAVYTKVGKRVNKGDVIGAVGENGRSTGPHLHFGMTLHGVLINPRPLLK